MTKCRTSETETFAGWDLEEGLAGLEVIEEESPFLTGSDGGRVDVGGWQLVEDERGYEGLEDRECPVDSQAPPQTLVRWAGCAVVYEKWDGPGFECLGENEADETGAYDEDGRSRWRLRHDGLGEDDSRKQSKGQIFGPISRFENVLNPGVSSHRTRMNSVGSRSY